MGETRPPYALRPEDGTVWPNPDYLADVQWRLRYGKPSREDLLTAAQAVAVYCELVQCASYGRRLPMVRRALLATRQAADGGGRRG